MSLNSSQLIGERRADFEALLQLVTGPEAQTATLDQMERSLFRSVLRLGRKLLAAFLAGRTEAERHTPQWGWQRQKVPYHSQKSVDYFSVFGKLSFERAYFYAAGQGGKCPLARAVSLPEHCYSDLLMECAEVVAVDNAYDKAVQLLQRLLDVNLSVLAVETSVAEHSQDVLGFYAPQAAFPRAEEGPILVVQADGKGVPLVRSEDEPAPKVRRSKGDKKTRKKEAIAVAVYTVAPYRRTPEEVVAALFHEQPPAQERPQLHHKQVFASLDGKAAALKRLARWAAKRDGKPVRQRVALTDGAAALQAQMRQHLSNFPLVLDIIHVVEHLWTAGTALYGETDPQRSEWVKTQLLDILSSRTEAVIAGLEAKAKRLAPTSQAARAFYRVAGYLRRNLPHLDYARYLKHGWPIGTGVIEGACRHLVKDRMELSGMRWTVSGAQALLALRAVNENGDWEDFHWFRRQRRHRQLYGKPLHVTWIDPIERLGINQF
ncbi:MAG TPA: ISKra4 family transposase [Anaerolineales bacterium]|nr:ISKra4 family transposase [Anaerolineales bacterium]